MDKDRKITIVSIIMWALCIIVLFVYYTFVKDDNRNDYNNTVQEVNNSENGNANQNSEYIEKAKQLISNMTLSEKVGQMFFVRCPENGAMQMIEKYDVGAFILFARDFEGKTKESVKSNIQSYQQKSKIPLLIGVDEEGGTVTRVSRFSAFRNEKFKSPMDLYKEGGLALIENDTKEKCELLSSLGINVNFAPVCDIATSEDAFIYRRTLGQDVEVTSSYVKQMVYQMSSLKMGSVLKHFPGYGNNKDTHTSTSNDNRSLDELREKDFLPFKAGIQAGAQCILVSHNIIESIDSENPASLSAKVHSILRNELLYNNVIITDDLDMDAIDSNMQQAQAAIEAVKAGNDMIVSSNIGEQFTAVKSAVSNGEISEDRINESVIRILIWKISLGLL